MELFCVNLFYNFPTDLKFGKGVSTAQAVYEWDRGLSGVVFVGALLGRSSGRGGEGYDLGRFGVPYFLCLCYNKYNKVNKSSMYIRKEFLL